AVVVQGTVQAWIDLNSRPAAGTSYVVLAKAFGTNTENYGLYINSAGELVFEWYRSATAYRVSSVGANLTTGSYHHVAATADGTTVKLYADGVLVGQGAMPVGLDATAPGPLEIGGLANASNTRFDGLIDEVAITQDPLGADDILRIFLNGGQGTDLGGSGTRGNVLLGNLIGLNPAGTLAIRNGANGVRIEDAAGNTVGGATAAARNVISGQS